MVFKVLHCCRALDVAQAWCQESFIDRLFRDVVLVHRSSRSLRFQGFGVPKEVQGPWGLDFKGFGV